MFRGLKLSTVRADIWTSLGGIPKLQRSHTLKSSLCLPVTCNLSLLFAEIARFSGNVSTCFFGFALGHCGGRSLWFS